MSQRSAILRAEILRGESTEVTCALEMTDRTVFIVTEGLPSIGETISMRLSFPRAVRPLLVSAKVLQVRLSNGPGTPSGFVGEFDVSSEDSRQRIADVAKRLRRTTLPGASGSQALGPSKIETPSKDLNVLLVEDNQLIRDMFRYAVEKYFKQRAGRVILTQASTVKEAWSFFEEKGRFDLALIDHFLADDTGASLITKLRQHPIHRRMSIVAMSVGGVDAQRSMVDAGADIFLHKPIVLKDLFCTLEFLMDVEAPSNGTGSSLGAA